MIYITWEAPIYEQTIYWETQNFTWIYGFDDNTPFYFGQLWSSEELKPVYNRLLTAVQFIPVTGSYEIYIVQGERNYRKTVTDVIRRTLNIIALDVPFVIGSEELIISVFANEYNSQINFPAACDNGPEEADKGKVISLNGINWYDTGEDINFIVAGVISSHKGSLTSDEIQVKSQVLLPAFTKQTFKIEGVSSSGSLKSQVITVFPELNDYNIYRNNFQLNNSLFGDTTYINKNVPEGNYTYGITAVYSGEESPLSEVIEDSTVDMFSIQTSRPGIIPVIFKDQVNFQQADLIEKIEVYYETGQLMTYIEKPGNSIQTGNWVTGVYIFRLHTSQGINVVKGIKKW